MVVDMVPAMIHYLDYLLLLLMLLADMGPSLQAVVVLLLAEVQLVPNFAVMLHVLLLLSIRYLYQWLCLLHQRLSI